jgi:hypothetical protein
VDRDEQSDRLAARGELGQLGQRFGGHRLGHDPAVVPEAALEVASERLQDLVGRDELDDRFAGREPRGRRHVE